MEIAFVDGGEIMSVVEEGGKTFELEKRFCGSG
jgi:hypothetical protein